MSRYLQTARALTAARVKLTPTSTRSRFVRPAQLPRWNSSGGVSTVPSFHTSNVHPISRQFSAARRDEPGEHDKVILGLLDRGQVNYNELDRVFAKMYELKHTELQLETFFSLVQRFQRIKDPRATEQIPTFILGWMLSFYKERRLDRPPKVELFGMTLQCFAKSTHPHAGDMAEQFLDEIAKLVEEQVLGIEVLNTHLYNTIMKAYANRGNAEKAQAMFDRCMAHFEEGNESARPDIMIWSTLIDAYAKSGRHDAGELALGKLREAEESFSRAVLKERPDTIIYNSVIDAFAKARRPQEAENVLEELNRVYLAGNTEAQPDVYSFTAVLNAWARSGILEGAQRSEKILNRMIKLFEDATLPVRPNTVSYSTVISAYGRQGLPREATKVLDRQHQDFLDGNYAAELEARSFTGVIDGWCKSGEAIAGEMAEKILDRMEDLHQQGVLKDRPHAHTYNAVMKAWATVCQPKNASAVFHKQLDDFESGNYAAMPSGHSYSTLMNAYKVAKLPDAGELADDAWDHMVEMKVEPDIAVYTAARSCWHCSKGHDPRAEKRCKELDAHIERLKKQGKN